jgi:hypothetical protein
MNKKPKKVDSFQKALDYFRATRPTCPTLISESHNLCSHLGGGSIHLEDTPFILEDGNDIDLESLESWLATTLESHANTLKTLLPNIDNSVEIVPNLLQGIVKEAQKGTTEMSKYVEMAKKDIRAGKKHTKHLEKAEQLLKKRSKQIDFFKKEVEERFDDFQESLSTYIIEHAIIEHLISCAQDLLSNEKTKLSKLKKKMLNFKGPL